MLDYYKDRDWLFNERYNQRRTSDEIADECGVSRKTVEHFIRKYSIPQPLRDTELTVEITCSHCRTPLRKTVRYLKQRVRKGIFSFYCGECLVKVKRETMSGEGNPNYGGTFHGENPSNWSKEKRSAATKKMVTTRAVNGTLRGSRNGRWAGGTIEFECVICGSQCFVKPYVAREIKAGDRKPCCSTGCARAYAVSHIKSTRTSIELRMAEELTSRGIEYIEQYVLGNKFSLDFFLPNYGIVIECDGDYWHRRPEVVSRDKSKNAYIRACGYTLFRFWESEINTSVKACVDVVLAEINTLEIS